MRLTVVSALLVSSVLFATVAIADAPVATPAYVTAAINNPARKDDTADDARRHPADVLMFARVRPGQQVLELVPGQGYWTRLFSGVVGGDGHVFTIWPDEMSKFSAKSYANWKGLITKLPYTNVSLLYQPAATLNMAQPVDLVFTSQNYHDYHDKFMGPVDMASFDKEVFDALKPGGYFVVIDHTAVAGSGFSATDTLHRVDPEAVKKEVEAAGFILDAESSALANPADPHTAKVFDPAIRGKTDQFMLRFKKPTQ